MTKVFKSMQLRTVVLFDMEYLLGSKGNSGRDNAVSLKKISSEIREAFNCRFSIQKAYANWWDPRLSIVKPDLLELGIEPIQKFGFGTGVPRSISRIQLILDAMSIACSQSNIERVIVVSGAYSLAALSNKLNQFGIETVCCAYRKDKEKIPTQYFESHIWLENPDKLKYSTIRSSDPIVYNYKKQFEPMDTDQREVAIGLCKGVINYVASNPSIESRFQSQGVNISVIAQLFDHRIKNFNFFKFGFEKFSDFISHVLEDTSCKIVFKAPSEYRIVPKGLKYQGFEDVQSKEKEEDLHTTRFYKKILIKAKPLHKQFNRLNFYLIAKYLTENKEHFKSIYFKDLIDDLGRKMDLEEIELKNTIYSMKNSGCILIDDEQLPTSKQKYSFFLETPDEYFEKVKLAMKSKLESILPEVKAEVFNAVLV